MSDDPMLTVPEVAERLRVSQEAVRRLLRTRALRGLQLSRRSGYRVPESELRRFITERLGRLGQAEHERTAAAA